MNTIKVYGSGCKSCIKLTDMCRDAINELQIEAEIVKVEDFAEIAQAGILSTPGLEINGNIISTGKIPVKATLLHWIKDNTN